MPVQKSSRFLWGFVFWISSGLYVIGAVYFGVFGSGEQQSWGRVASEGEGEGWANDAAAESSNVVEEGGGGETTLDAQYKRTLDVASDGRANAERVPLNAEQTATAVGLQVEMPTSA